ncbi:hypothetical protein AAH994_14710 [Weeksellaceae bacterium A-14]
MKIVHRVCNNWTEKQVRKLQEYGLAFKEGELDCKDLEENELYFNIKSLLERWEVFDVRGVVFEKNEVLESEYSIITGYNIAGYPMPDNLEYQKLTYNIDNWCSSCGGGLVQKSAFRLKKLPNLKNKVFGLHWVYDELFVEKDYYEKIFKPLNIANREVMLYKGDKVIDELVQLVLPTCEDELDLVDYEYEICPICGRKKYSPMPLGFFPLQENPLPFIYKSKEYFGSGASANRKIFISKDLRDILIKDKAMAWQWFTPCG